MHGALACLMCSIDPSSTSVLLPVAQATIISVPILMRDQIRHGVHQLRDRRRPASGDDPDPEGDPLADGDAGQGDGSGDPGA